LVLEEKGHHLILNILNNRTTITPNVMRYLEREVPKAEQYIDKQAIIGFSQIQKWIIKGMDLWYTQQIHPFDSFDDALEFLTMDEKKIIY
jgi:hypothetical protein